MTMKTVFTLTLGTVLGVGVLAAGVIATTPVSAHGPVSCDVPRKERQPSVRLQKQLLKAGWSIRKMQDYNGCYEVYGTDETGKSVEAFFDPRTLERKIVAE